MAMIDVASIGKLAALLTKLVVDEAVTVLGVKEEIRLLQERMQRITSVLQDAEIKRIQSANVEGWLKDLTDVMYDAEDIIDRCRVQGNKLLDDQQSASCTKMLRYSLHPWLYYMSDIPFRREIANDIIDLNKRLDRMLKDRVRLSLGNNDIHICRIDDRSTSSVMGHDIVKMAIESATQGLVELIARKDDNKCRIFAITGMGGIGKTMLAKSIFNHQKMHSKSFTKIWISVTRNYVPTDLLKEIIRGAGGIHGDLTTKTELLNLLKNVFEGKRLFLVLDDVWQENVWVDLLRIPLESALNCQILVTTRNQYVAMRMKAVHTYPVKLMPVEYGLELLCKKLFSHNEEEEMSRFRTIGIQIVQKCHGLPLTIASIANILITKKRERKEWESILESDAWSIEKLPHKLSNTLESTYEDLPSNLKQCFLYFSLFPKDYSFSRLDIIKYWVAEGFVDIQKRDFFKSACDNFEELVKRNLIHVVDDTFDCVHYKMHDILQSFAQFRSKSENFCGEAKVVNIASTTTRLRRLNLTTTESLSTIKVKLFQQKSLRTLVLKNCPSLENDLLTRFPVLRHLVLNDSTIHIIPDTVRYLAHLRLLDLCRTNVSALPESIKYLTNLQVLKLSDCKLLHIIPEGVTQLCNLWFIDFSGTPLYYMPSGMGKLVELHVFKGFVVGDDGIRSAEQSKNSRGCELEELNSLLKLRELSISNLEKAVAQKGQLILTEDSFVQNLELSCNWDANFLFSDMEKNFEELELPSNLEILKINGYFGRKFPGWMMSSSVGIRSLYLYNCPNVLRLPSLGLLPELRHLEIENAPGIGMMGPEFLGSAKAVYLASFPKLEALKIIDMPNLEKWTFYTEYVAPPVLPCLRYLTICDCPKLKSLPNGFKHSSLKGLFTNCFQIIEEVSGPLQEMRSSPVHIDAEESTGNESIIKNALNFMALLINILILWWMRIGNRNRPTNRLSSKLKEIHPKMDKLKIH